jgi:hypothetical protein
MSFAVDFDNCQFSYPGMVLAQHLTNSKLTNASNWLCPFYFLTP